MRCSACGHLQLATFLDPSLLYGSEYHFRTGDSAMARAGTAFFLDFLDRLAPKRRYRVAVDVGCNDLHCLAGLKDSARRRIGVDPIWASRDQARDDGITVIGKTIEEANWHFLEGESADLIICRHTLEHLKDPRTVIEQFLQRLSDEGILIIEVPAAEPLIEKFRFDQIFHQHLHYFSRPILSQLIRTSGGEVIDEAENWTNWGARLIAARKSTPNRGPVEDGVVPNAADIARRYAIFQQRMKTTIESLLILSETNSVVGYGAGQMLPVLSWHLGTDLGFLEGVLDDDRSKDGMRYANLPLTICHPRGAIDWQNRTVMITAVDHAPSIIRKLCPEPPRHVVHPLCFL